MTNDDEYTGDEQEERREWLLGMSLQQVEYYLDDVLHFAKQDTELFRKASELQDEIIRYKSGPKRD